ncbi:class III poly(R)-hydroxyalkanoic acid synthase subunit PhaE [Ectothiorhodospira mobilis]|uniref:class III poly(R)-hydroxyalkanoic acid synthase subunit PhaE n=1 Tax=Ectothiorhodospira mobilis TaxID=195064 RepID=UPI001EE8C566|nr:class III poly(R)-hydroxyalkanoic acid synthase subunit PhaE [Ectothiorhodospira mobilis]MCG5535795.1 class III poly(R)-hydroxyalkanoic acid synthase subunit PhaE [Ectothiorhodospira mobilis]
MADSNPFNPEDWLEAQRRYWDAWMDMSRKAMGSGGEQADWSRALDQWWQAAAQGLPQGTTGFLEPMLQMGRNYFSMAEQFHRNSGGQEGATEAVHKWLEQMTEAFRQMGTGSMSGKDMNAFWQMPLDTWRRATSSFMPMPGDFMQALRPAARPPYGDVMQEQLDRFLSVPGVGYTRESQEQYQDLARLAMEYQQALQNYQATMARVGMDSVERFRARLEDAGRQDKPISSLRTLYDEWVDVCEEVYGEFTLSEEYARVYGEMVNSLMALKRQGTRFMDEAAESLNMPTRREVNTLHRRLQESRRELHQIRSALRELQENQAKKGDEAKAGAQDATSGSSGTRSRSGRSGGRASAAKGASGNGRTQKSSAGTASSKQTDASTQTESKS